MDNPYAGDTNTRYDDDLLSSVDMDYPGDRIPLFKVPFAFFFKPGQYMQRNGVRASEGYLAMVIWLTGAALVIGSFEQKIALGRTSLWFPESWIELSLVALFGGILRGLFVYGIGGLWFRLRLHMCGDKRSEWSKTGRIYMLSGTARHIGTLVFISIGALSFPSFQSYAENGDGAMVYITAIAVMVLLIWSSFTLYFGVRAVFPVNKLWAMVWFLILPVILRLIGISALLVGAYLIAANPEPMLDQPSTHQGSSIRFEYPSNWYINADTEVPGPETWVQARSDFADAFIQLAIFEKYEDQDQIAENLAALTEDGDITLISEDSQLTSLGGLSGKGTEYTVEIEGGLYVLDLFLLPLGQESETLVMIVCSKDTWDTVDRAFWHVLKTMKISDPYTLAPDLNRTYSVEGGGASFDIPSNWWLTVQEEEDTTNEDGSVSRGSASIRTSTPGFGYFQFYTYQSSIGPRGELGISLEEFTDSGRLIGEQDLDEWFGFSGFGVHGISPSEDGLAWETKILVSKLPDGRLIEFRSVYPQEYSEQYVPGMDLIERTFRFVTD